MIKDVLIVGIGGFIGSSSRYLFGQLIYKYFDTTFPLGTLIINLIGCFLIGLILGLFEKGNIISLNMNLFLTVGICGGFTTFSTFSNDSLILIKNNEIVSLLIYLSVSVLVGLLMTFLGKYIISYF